jgi:hypothetical protein
MHVDRWNILPRMQYHLLFGSPESYAPNSRLFWICSQELWPLDHRGGQLQAYIGTNTEFQAACQAYVVFPILLLLSCILNIVYSHIPYIWRLKSSAMWSHVVYYIVTMFRRGLMPPSSNSSTIKLRQQISYIYRTTRRHNPEDRILDISVWPSYLTPTIYELQ